jgi:tripartite-type tricarboxylate transporter receptor subunit TctC
MSNSSPLRSLLAKLLFACVATCSAGAQAQGPYPSKPIRLVVPFPAGGAVDTFARTIQPELSVQLGQPVIIINKPGGGSQIAAADILSSPADGYTVFVAQIGDYTVNPVLYKSSNYLPPRDFDGVTMAVRAPQVMLANATNTKVNSLKTLKDTIAQRGANLLYSSFGAGTAPHLLGHLLARNAAAQLTHVPYKGFPPAMQALLTNEVDLLFDAVPGAVNMMRGGKVVPLAVADTQRNSHLPNVPTTAEIGFPALVMDFWIGMAVKKGTPRTIVTRLNEAFDKAVGHPDNLKRFTDLGYTRVSMTPEQFDTVVRTELEKMKPLIAETGVVVD